MTPANKEDAPQDVGLLPADVRRPQRPRALAARSRICGAARCKQEAAALALFHHSERSPQFGMARWDGRRGGAVASLRSVFYLRDRNGAAVDTSTDSGYNWYVRDGKTSPALDGAGGRCVVVGVTDAVEVAPAGATQFESASY